MGAEQCYICNTPSALYSDLSKTRSTHTKTPICDFIDRIVGDTVAATERVHWNDCIVCIECLGKIDEYDLACQTAHRVENELRKLLLRPKSEFVEPVVIFDSDNDEVHDVESVDNVKINDCEVDAVACDDDESNTINLDGPYQLTELKIDQVEMNDDDDDEDCLPLDEDDIDIQVIGAPVGEFTCDNCKAIFDR